MNIKTLLTLLLSIIISIGIVIQIIKLYHLSIITGLIGACVFLYIIFKYIHKLKSNIQHKDTYEISTC